MLNNLRIVAFGDSLTQGNAIDGKFKNWTEIVEEELKIKIINSGIGGNTTKMALERFEKDVLEYNPDIVFINFGMNDHVLDIDGNPYVELDEFEKNIFYFIDEINKIGSKPVIITPNYFIEGNEKKYYYSRHTKQNYMKYGGALALFDQYTEKLRDIAARKNISLIDIRKECEKYNPYDFLRTLNNCNANDGVHPGKLGVRVYADKVSAWLKEVWQ